MCDSPDLDRVTPFEPLKRQYKEQRAAPTLDIISASVGHQPKLHRRLTKQPLPEKLHSSAPSERGARDERYLHLSPVPAHQHPPPGRGQKNRYSQSESPDVPLMLRRSQLQRLQRLRGPFPPAGLQSRKKLYSHCSPHLAEGQRGRERERERRSLPARC